MRRSHGLFAVILFAVLLIGPTVTRYLSFYRLGGTDREAPPNFEPLEDLIVPQPASNEFADEPEVGSGFILIDQAHANDVDVSELRYLDSRLAARGFEFLTFSGGDLAASLRSVSAFVVIAPLDSFDDDEIQAVSEFVERGGRLLLMGDPTTLEVRFEETDFAVDVFVDTDDVPLNTLANEFDIVFSGDYVFNTLENESNFRNILFAGRQLDDENALTTGLDTVVLYGSHSIDVGEGGTPLLTGDNNTYSSATDRPGDLVMAALDASERVMAIGDFNFMTAPYFSTFDNRQFIARIADFLTASSDREYVLGDFPYFYTGDVDLVYTGNPELGPNAFAEVNRLNEAFDRIDIELNLRSAPQSDQDALYLGIYNQADEDVREILASKGISLTIVPEIIIDPPEEEEDDMDEEDVEQVRNVEAAFGDVQMSGTALILFDRSDDGEQRVIVLAASTAGLGVTVDRLLSLMPIGGGDGFDDCFLQETLALCPTGIEDEEVEAELDTTGSARGDTGMDTSDEDESSGGSDTGAYIPEIDATVQGTIEIGDSVEGELDADESDAWEFVSGPATIDIFLNGGETLDAVLEIYDADYSLVSSVDSTFGGGVEELIGVEIPAGETYTIVARDFFNDGGTYTLDVFESSADSGGGGPSSAIDAVFIFADDAGTPQAGGITGEAFMADVLEGAGYEVTVWRASQDGSIPSGALSDFDLFIWESGDYRGDDFDPDTFDVIIEFLAGGGRLFVTGATPPLLEPIADLTTLADVAIEPTSEILTAGLTPGDVYELDQSYDVAFDDAIEADDDITFMSAGPASAAPGYPIGIGGFEGSDPIALIMLAPYGSLPLTLQETLLFNIVLWLSGA